MKRQNSLPVILLLFLMLSVLAGCSSSEPAAENTGGSEPIGENVPVENSEEPAFEIIGKVEEPSERVLADFTGDETLLTAEEKQCSGTLEARDYEGILLRVILEKAGPVEDASKVTINAADGYSKSFPLESIMVSDDIILANIEGSLRIIAAEYDASYWISDVNAIEVK